MCYPNSFPQKSLGGVVVATAFKSRTKRFDDKKVVAPGPGASRLDISQKVLDLMA